MADITIVLVRTLHIVFGVAWVGALLFSVAVLGRVFPRLGLEDGKPFYRLFTPVVTRYMPAVATLTLVFGTLLYLLMGNFDPTLLYGTEWGRVLLGAFVVTIIMYVHGTGTTQRTAKKLEPHLQEELCEHQAEVGTMMKRIGMSQFVSLIFGITILFLMVLVTAPVF